MTDDAALTRRSFLVGSGVSAHAVRAGVGITAAQLARGGTPTLAGTATSTSVGYVTGSGGTALTSGSHLVVPAGLVFGDRSLRGPVHVTVHGLLGSGATSELVGVDALWPALDGDEPTRFHVWRSGSPGVRYSVHVGEGVEPAFELQVGGAATSTRFAVTDDPGVPSLRRGTYLLGLTPGAWRRPAFVTLDGDGRSVPPSVLVSVDSVS